MTGFQDNSREVMRLLERRIEGVVRDHTVWLHTAVVTSLNRTASALSPGFSGKKAAAQRPRGLPGPPLKRTGTLQRSVQFDVAKEPDRVYGRVGFAKGSPASYAEYLEFGTRKMPAYPFLRPALDRGNSRFRFALRKIGRGI